MNNFISHENNLERAQISSLRRYLVARASGRKHPEWAYFEVQDGLGIWCGCNLHEAKTSGKTHRQLKMSDCWCPWLGSNTSIKDDHLLSAFFELKIANDETQEVHQWSLLLKEFYKNRAGAMRKWRELGAQILDRSRQRVNSSAASAAASKLLVSEKYQKRGTGIRTLKSSKPS